MGVKVAVLTVFVLIIIVALILIVAALLPKEYTVVRSTTINKPVESVYSVVADYGQRKAWDPWIAMEPDAAITLEGAEGIVGSKYTWDGKEIGSGSMLIEKAIENEHIQAQLKFTAPWESEAVVKWNLTPEGEGTKVDWIMEGKNAYPLGRYMGLMMDGMIGKDLVQGLENLKAYIEGMEEEE